MPPSGITGGGGGGGGDGTDGSLTCSIERKIITMGTKSINSNRNSFTR